MKSASEMGRDEVHASEKEFNEDRKRNVRTLERDEKRASIEASFLMFGNHSSLN